MINERFLVSVFREKDLLTITVQKYTKLLIISLNKKVAPHFNRLVKGLPKRHPHTD